MKYFALARYVGTAFSGFQVQPGRRTVQGELCRAAAAALGAPVQITGCSRTDAGVHADAFAMTVDCPGATVPPDRLPMAIARFLPDDISLFYAKECDDSFHPRYHALGKEYRYRLLNTPVRDPFLWHRVWHLPQPIGAGGLARMRQGAAALLGQHDFSSFMAAGSDVADHVRTVTQLTVDTVGDEWRFTVRADGFLYNMVRIIVGTLVDMALGRMTPEDMPGILARCDRDAAGMTAPADGLYLHRVFYAAPFAPDGLPEAGWR